MTLEQLGLSRTTLILLFIVLLFSLLIFFAFIFSGIKAFALGGGMGAIINSLFPMLGGGVAGKEDKKKKDSLNLDTISESVELAMNKLTSETY